MVPVLQPDGCGDAKEAHTRRGAIWRQPSAESARPRRKWRSALSDGGQPGLDMQLAPRHERKG
jgi:hypothetical protein